MAVTIDDLETEIASVGGFDATEEASTITRFAIAGLRQISLAGAWPWLKAAFNFDLVEGQYAYDIPTYVGADAMRLDVQSLRFGGDRAPLTWTRAEAIDTHLGAEWKADATPDGSVEFAARMGNELWLARKPSDTWIASKPTLYGYYFRREPTTDGATLYLPDEFLPCALHASLAYGWLAEDDPRASEMMMRFEQTDLPRMRGFQQQIGDFDRLEEPDWMRYGHEGWGNYGDDFPGY